MEGCLLCLDVNEKLVSYIEVNSLKWKEQDVEKLIEKHFWPVETLQSYLWLCTACWQELYKFHKFYKRIFKAHTNFRRLMKTEDDCQLLQYKDKLLNVVDYNTSLHSDSIVDSYVEPEILLDQPLQESLVIMEEHKLNIKEEPREEFNSDDIIINHRSRRRHSEHLGNEDPLKNTKKFKLGKTIKSKYSATSTRTIPNDQASDKTPIKQDPDLFDINKETNLILDSTNNVNSDTDSSYEPEKDTTENNSPKKNYYKHRTHRKENDKFIAENFKEMFCSLCQFPMENFRAMHKHFAEEHNQKGYVVCCTRKFYGRSLLVDHLHCHLNPDHFKCNQCNKVMSDRIRLESHLKHIHGEGDDLVKKHCCNVCGKSFAEAHKLKSHKLTHLSEEEKMFPCTECGKSYGSAYKLNYHIQAVHRKKFAKICFICGKSISSNCEFKTHMDKHEGKPAPLINCDVCGLRLTSARGLKRHKDAQHPEGGKKDHCCPICPKVSPTLKALKKHINTMHERGYDHKCTVCEKAFKRAEALKEHMSFHTGTPLYTCPHCPKTFNSNGNMHSHRKKIHPTEWKEAKLQKYSGNLPQQYESSANTNEKVNDVIVQNINDKINGL